MTTTPKGFVEPTEMNALCDKIRVLLENRKNVALESDWLALQRYTTLTRCFTICERNSIESIFGSYLGWKRRKK